MNRMIIIILCCMCFIISCRKIEPQAPVIASTSIFSISHNTVSNGSQVLFTLKNSGTYTLTMTDSATSQVVTRERFLGKVGENKFKIYTNSLPVKYLYLTLEDSAKTQLGKTVLIIN